MMTASTAASASKTNTEVSTNSDGSRAYQTLVGALRMEASIGGNADELRRQAVDKIASAETLDELFDANDGGLSEMAEHTNKPLNIFRVSFTKSEEKYAAGGLGAYAVIEAEDDLGNELVLTTGAANVVSTLFVASNKGWITPEAPFRCAIVTKETSGGTLYKVGRVPARKSAK